MLKNDLMKEKNEYIISRDDVQMDRLTLNDIKVQCFDRKAFSNDVKNLGIHIKRNLKKIGTQDVEGTLETHIEIRKDDITCVEMDLIHIGNFHTLKEMTEEEFIHRVYVQMVPQIFPYIRSAVSGLSAMMGIPPLVLPTMDILRSIKVNEKV